MRHIIKQIIDLEKHRKVKGRLTGWKCDWRMGGLTEKILSLYHTS